VPAATEREIVALRRRGLSYAAIADLLEERGVQTVDRGRRWWPSTVRNVCVREGVPDPGLRRGLAPMGDVDEALRLRREGVTQRAIANLLGVSPMTVSRILRRTGHHA